MSILDEALAAQNSALYRFAAAVDAQSKVLKDIVADGGFNVFKMNRQQYIDLVETQRELDKACADIDPSPTTVPAYKTHLLNGWIVDMCVLAMGKSFIKNRNKPIGEFSREEALNLCSWFEGKEIDLDGLVKLVQKYDSGQ